MNIRPKGSRPLDRRKVYEQVADQLLGLIGSRLLQPGDVLPPERELTESFAVGRSSIREALRMLESQGVIMSEAGGTFVVASVSNPLNTSLQLIVTLDQATGLRDIFELRRVIECEAAALAAERRTEAHVQRMTSLIEVMAAALPATGAEEAFVDADMRFHLEVAEATSNRLLAYAMQAARDVLRAALVAVIGIPQSAERAIGEHRLICDAIGSQDVAAARAAMKGHLDRVQRDVEKGAGHG